MMARGEAAVPDADDVWGLSEADQKQILEAAFNRIDPADVLTPRFIEILRTMPRRSRLSDSEFLQLMATNHAKIYFASSCPSFVRGTLVRADFDPEPHVARALAAWKRGPG